VKEGPENGLFARARVPQKPCPDKGAEAVEGQKRRKMRVKKNDRNPPKEIENQEAGQPPTERAVGRINEKSKKTSIFIVFNKLQ
jgi:hypothetical protein